MEELLIKKGDIYYKVNWKDITKYEYFDKFPFNTIDTYHILINRTTEQPERFYQDHLIMLINSNIRTYEEAKIAYIKELEETIKQYKEL